MSGKPTIALARCGEYDDSLGMTLEKALAPLGGLMAFVKEGQKVLLKPNMLCSRTPEEAVTTHPELVRAVIRIVRDCRALPLVGDSPAEVASVEKVWDRTGIGRVCAEEKVPLVNFEKAGSKRYEVNGVSFTIAKPVIEADVVINLPKVKTHVLTILTGGVKNLYGTLPGYQKAMLHRTCPSANEFSALLEAIYRQVRPALTIADGIVGMEGDGPSAGNPVRLGFVVASADAAWLDAGLCTILGVRTHHVVHINRIMGGKASSVEFLGEKPEAVMPAFFRKPSTLRARLIPAWLVKRIGRMFWIRPSFSEKCVSCGQCLKACPAGALSMGPKRRPLLKRAECVGCCCCHEICPVGAVEMKSSLLSRILFGARKS